MVCGEAKEKVYNDVAESGLAKTGALAKDSLIMLKQSGGMRLHLTSFPLLSMSVIPLTISM